MQKADFQSEEDVHSEAETEARREAALKRMLAMPPKPHAKVGKVASKER